MSTEVEVGQVLDERFHITELVSRSGMASIFKATGPADRRDRGHQDALHAVRERSGLFQPLSAGRGDRQDARHPYICAIMPVEEKSRPYIVMEFLRGQTLRQVLRSVERMPVADALNIASRICEALEYLHGQNVIHRDLKPENIMLCDDGSIRLMDFGIAKAAGLRRLTFSGFSASLGTPDYMAPEQVKGKRGDARTDIYSLGAMLYEMVTGALPFEGTNPYAIMHARLAGDPVASAQVESGDLAAGRRDHLARPGAAALRPLSVGRGDEGRSGGPRRRCR